ncbi:hypothetical protein DEU56DRAFT_782495 [Suillus clintonianus]|uniref:uncharacterized protein n=1 Tax=Suillus clintonianus TaxID=1904413 RepID=UPI001B86E76E|nr:uncharacterized protein DEU56DRAFT_782495 [Suillus clintonianus]KAG2148842.1 hypothetical protein DEU56DRAFT_782495 [Suillus clintonianus]
MKITLWEGKHIAPELASPSPSCLDVQATGNNEEGHDDPYNHDNFFRSSRPSGPSSGPPRSSQRLPPSTRRFWSILMPSRHHPPVNLSSPQPRPKRSFFAWHTGPKPVTVSAGRRKNRIYVALPPSQKKNADTNTQAGQTSSTGQPHLVSNMPQHTQTQSETQPAQEDYGCWGNFCLALGCVPRRSVPSAVQASAS